MLRAMKTPTQVHFVIGCVCAAAIATSGCSSEKSSSSSSAPAEKSSGGEGVIGQARHDVGEAGATIEGKAQPAGEWLDEKGHDVASGVEGVGSDARDAVGASPKKSEKRADKPAPADPKPASP